jgi:hypothetical protein
MAENPYSMPLHEFEARFRVPVAEQTEVQPLPAATAGLDWGDGCPPAGDADGGGGAD